MKIKSLQLKNFKRFTDLTLQGIPEDAKLVLLIGSNGSGKSSVFDGIAYFAKNNKVSVASSDYISKNADVPEIHIGTEYGQVGIVGGNFRTVSQITSTSFYGRSSFRQIPRLLRTSLGSRFDIVRDSDRPATFIDRDERFENDLEHIYGRLLREYFVNNDRSKIIEEVVNPINNSFERVFGNSNGTKLRLKEIIPPLEGKVAQINFEKGNSSFHYNYLSAGEKEVFNILINLLARKEYYQDTVFFYDEIDLHLNTKLQFNFLKEIIEHWIPNNCQLWTASHSLGFIQYAKESDQAVIFDLDDYDFDNAKVLSPEPKNNPDIYEIAVGRDILPTLFKGFIKVFVENTDGDNYYSNLKIENFLFVKRKDKKAIYDNILTGDNLGLIDRDFLSDEDIALLEKAYKNLKVLKMYSVENYLFYPDNLVEYCHTKRIPFNPDDYVKEVAHEKERIKHELFAKISDSRQTYPFGKEVDPIDKAIQLRFSKSEENRKQISSILKEIDSPNFAQYYKHLPMKDHLTQLAVRKSIPKTELAKTNWFKQQIEAIIKQK